MRAVRTPSGAAEFIIQRGPTLSNHELVEELNAAGFRTGMGRAFDIAAVQWVRYAHQVPSPSPFQPGELSVNEVAAQLGISTGAVYDWIECGHLPARRTTTGRLGVAFAPEVEAACRASAFLYDVLHIGDATAFLSELARRLNEPFPPTEMTDVDGVDTP